MALLIFNAALRIESDDLCGFYRVVATPPGFSYVWLAFAAPWGDARGKSTFPGSLTKIERATLEAFEEAEKLVDVDLQPEGKLLTPTSALGSAEKDLWERRCELMKPFFDHRAICDALQGSRGLGPLVRAAMSTAKGSRASIYRLWPMLCKHGFDQLSLMPRFDKCGAPGVPRPVTPTRRKAGAKTLNVRLGNPEPYPQAGVTEEDRIKIVHHYRALAKPGKAFRQLYDETIERAYVTQYQQTDSGREPILPIQGSFPNQRQFRNVIEFDVKRLERTMLRTTKGHFDRNMRGLRGRSYDGVAGPGHVYAIDSTIGDIHLRSSINRAWPIGRPIVYIVIDVWSTAIVGFYVCLSGPSWETAKLALFSAFCDPKLLAELWGVEFVDVLTPFPTAPYKVMCDRGEYLSLGARETCEQLAINFMINAAYRPDLKGLVEVVHRIAKDQQFSFLPGAIDARRRELELKTSGKESALTLREYVAFLHGIFNHYNLFADRSHRMTSEMIAANAMPSPAGLWRFGHEMGIGYQKAMPQDRLLSGLLQQKVALSRRDGVFLESLQYESPIAHEQNWSALARNFGSDEKTVFQFPGSTSRIWWPDPVGRLHEFKLRANARAPGNVSVDEWRDAVMDVSSKKNDRAYLRLQAAVNNIDRQAAVNKRAVELTREAEREYEGPRLTAREARLLETMPKKSILPPPDNTNHGDVTERNPGYESLMNQVFAEIDKEAGECN